MSQELYYTSSPQGLELGTSGFTTVAATRGLSPRLKEKLQAQSTYRHLFPPLDPRNPTIFSHVKVSGGGPLLDVLSRVSDAPLDYTGRGNYFAHHVILEPHEVPRAGPAWLLLQPSFLEGRWQGEPRWLDAPRRVPSGDISPIQCLHWGQWTGDPGWAGALLQEFDRDPNRPAALLTPPGFEALPLLTEALALLPVERRWEVTFSTLYLGVQPGTLCTWRFLPKALADSERPGWLSGAFIIDLSTPRGRAPDSPYAEAARAGRAIRRPVSAPVPASVGAGADIRSSMRDPRKSAPDPYPTPAGLARPPRPEQLAVNNQPAEAPPPAPPAESPASPEESHFPREKPVGRFSFVALAVGVVIGLVIAGGGAMAYWQLGGLKDELEKLRKDKPELETALGNEKTALASMTQDKNTIAGLHKDVSGDRDKLRKEKEELEKQVAALSGSSNDKGKEVVRLNGEIAKLNREKAGLANELTETTARAGKMSALFKAIREEFAAHEGLLKSMDTALKNPNETTAAEVGRNVAAWREYIGQREIDAQKEYAKNPVIWQKFDIAWTRFKDYDELVRKKDPKATLFVLGDAQKAYDEYFDKYYLPFVKKYDGTLTVKMMKDDKEKLDVLRKKYIK